MPIIRVSKHDDHYVTINRHGIENERLSFGARGLLAYLLTKPDDWKVNFRHLMKVGVDGERKVLRYLKELETCGYLTRKRRHIDGRFTWEQVLSDYPKRRNNADVLKAYKPSTLSNDLPTGKEISNNRKNRSVEACPECGCDIRNGRCGWCGVVVG